jgi:lipopolysaccharide export system permease protein
MLKVLDRYLLKYFIIALLLVTFGIGLLILVINMIEELQRFVDNDVPMKEIIIYYVYFAGWILKSFLPVFVLLAALISIGILARRNEILAMKASGISLYRIAAPFLIFTFLLSIAHIYYNEVIYAEANKKRVEIKEYTIQKRPSREKKTVRNIYRQVDKDFFYTIASYNAATMEGREIRLYRSDQDRLIELITAQRIDYGSKGWVLHDGIKRIFHDSTESFDQFDSMAVSYIKEKPSDFEIPLGKPEDMSYSELSHYIKMMKRTGGPYQRELVDLRLKLSYPFSSFIVILICVPIASNPKRGGIAISVALGTGIALLYFVCFKITQSFGYNERLEPDVAAWTINVIFLVAGLLIMWKTRK